MGQVVKPSWLQLLEINPMRTADGKAVYPVEHQGFKGLRYANGTLAPMSAFEPRKLNTNPAYGLNSGSPTDSPIASPSPIAMVNPIITAKQSRVSNIIPALGTTPYIPKAPQSKVHNILPVGGRKAKAKGKKLTRKAKAKAKASKAKKAATRRR